MADRYCSVRFKTGEELDKALAAALCSCDDAARAEAAAARAEEIQNKVDETVTEALTQAKESGAFDGPAGQDGRDGEDGYTPRKGVDYWTETDQAEVKAYVDERLADIDISGGNTVTEMDILPEMTYEGFETDESFGGMYVYNINPAPFTLKAGETYIVEWDIDMDGGTFTCIAQDLSSLTGADGFLALGDVSSYGGSGNEEPFLIGWTASGVTIAALNGGTSHTIRIYQTGASGGGSDSLPDNVPYTEEKSSAMTFAETPEHSFEALGNMWWKVSDLVPSTEEILGGTFTFDFGSGAVSWTPTEEELLMDSEEFTGVQSAAYGAGFAICRATGEHTVSYGGADYTVNIPATGIYFGYATGTAVPEAVAVSVAYTELHKLDERLLPVDAVRSIVDEVINEALGGDY